jgi:hypothetical protein
VLTRKSAAASSPVSTSWSSAIFLYLPLAARKFKLSAGCSGCHRPIRLTRLALSPKQPLLGRIGEAKTTAACLRFRPAATSASTASGGTKGCVCPTKRTHFRTPPEPLVPGLRQPALATAGPAAHLVARPNTTSPIASRTAPPRGAVRRDGRRSLSEAPMFAQPFNTRRSDRSVANPRRFNHSPVRFGKRRCSQCRRPGGDHERRIALRGVRRR